MPVLNIRVSPTGQPRCWRVEIEGHVVAQSTREPLRALALHLLASGAPASTVISQTATPSGKCRRGHSTLAAILRAPDRDPFAAPEWICAPTNGAH